MTSVFVGLRILVVFWGLAPLTMLWLVGERIQGRQGFPMSHSDLNAWPSWQAAMLMIGLLLWLITIGAIRTGCQ